MSGVFLILMGAFRLGTLVRFIPIAVIIGFTNGIAVLIGLSQLKDFLGLSIEKMPAQFFPAIQVLYQALSTFNPIALAVACGSIALIIFWKLFQKNLGHLRHIPGTVIAMVAATIITTFLNLPIDTIGSRFGGIPSGLPHFEWIPISWSDAQNMVIPALINTAIELFQALNGEPLIPQTYK
jgi:SulP family sulfate permease